MIDASAQTDNDNSADIDVAAEIEATEAQNAPTSNSLLGPRTEVKTETTEATPVSEKPEHWPEDLWDAEKGVPKLDDAYNRMTKAEKASTDLRKILGDKKSFEAYKKEQGQELKGDTPERYEFEKISDDFQGDRESIDLFSNAAKEAGLNNDQANMVLNKYLEQDEARTIAKRDSEIKKLGDDGEGMLISIDNFITTRVNNGTLSEEEAQSLAGTITDASSARAMSKIISMTGEMKIPTSTNMISQSKSLGDIKQDMVEALKTGDKKEINRLREQLHALPGS